MAFGSGGINGQRFDTRSVSLGPNGKIPYINMSGSPAMSPQPSSPASATLGAESVRATGSGPFDPAYRQNLATYAGGQFARPGGNLSFNPTGTLFGNPTGGGNAPVQGMPDSLIGNALSGNPFSFTPPAPSPTDNPVSDPLGWWRDQFLNDGKLFGGYGLRQPDLQY